MLTQREEAIKELARRELARRKEASPENQWQNIQKQHPFLAKLSEHLQGLPGLEKAGRGAEHIENIIAGTGLPNAAAAAFQGGSNIIRGVGNLIPGVNIPNPKFNEAQIASVNPTWQNIVGNAAMMATELLPVNKIQQGIHKGIETLPHAEKFPEALKALLSGAATGATISPDHRGLGALIGGVASSVPEIIQGGKNIYNWTQAPKRELTEHENLIEKLQNMLSGKSENLNPLKQTMPNKGQTETFENLAEQTSRKEQQLQKHFDEQYNNFYKSEAGQAKIPETFQANEINKMFKDVKGIKPVTKKIANNISETKVKLPLIDSTTGKEFEIIYPAKNAKVEDYLKFAQEAGSAAHIAHNDAKYSLNLTPGEKSNLFNLSNKLKELQNVTENKVKNVIPEEYKSYELIKEDYKKLKVPFKKHESSILHNLSQRKRITGDIQKELAQPNNKYVRAFLTADPSFRKALVDEALRGGKNPLTKETLSGQGKAIQKLLIENPDTFKLLTPSQQKLLLQQNKLARETESQLNLLRQQTEAKKQAVTKRKIQTGAALAAGTVLGGNKVYNKAKQFLR